METLLVILIIGAGLAGLVYLLRMKLRNLRATTEFAVGMGQQMWGRGTRLSGLIAPGDDAVASIIDARMATVGLAAAVLAQGGRLGQADWRAFSNAITQQYQTGEEQAGEEQAGDMVMLSKWLVGTLRSEADLDRLTQRAAELSQPDQVAEDCQALVSRTCDATGRTPDPALSRVLDLLSRA